MWAFDWWCGSGCESRREPFSPLCFLWRRLWSFVAERRPARLRFAFLPCGVRVPGWRAWRVGWRFGRLLRIFLARCAIWNCYSLWLLAPSGSLCGVLRGVEALVRALGCLRRASPREARTARFLYVLWSLGVAWFLWWCYFVVIVAVSLVCCPVAGARVFLTDGARVGGRMRFHVNNQGRVLPCRAKHACRFGASFENGGGGTNSS